MRTYINCIQLFHYFILFCSGFWFVSNFRAKEILSEEVLGHWMLPPPLLWLCLKLGQARACLDSDGRKREERERGEGAGEGGSWFDKLLRPKVSNTKHHSLNKHCFSFYNKKKTDFCSEIVFWSLSQTDVDDMYIVVVVSPPTHDLPWSYHQLHILPTLK